MAIIGIVARLGGELGHGGGVDVYARSLVDALARHGRRHSYVILCSGEPSRDWRERDWPGHIRLAGVPSLGTRRGAYRLARLKWAWQGREARGIYGAFDAYWRELPFVHAVRRDGMDAVHFPCTVIPVQWCPVPMLVTFFDMQHEYMPEFFPESLLASRRKVYEPSVQRAKRVLASSVFTSGTLAEKYGVAQDKVDVVPVGIEPDYGELARRREGEARARYGLADQRYAIYPANPWPHKNHTRLLSALRHCRDCFGEKITLVCTGRLKDQAWSVEMLSVAAGVEEQVRDLGFLSSEDVAGLVAGAEFMVFPSLFEGFGIPILEAMACGCPVCAANDTSIPELLAESGLLFDPGNMEEMASAMRLLWGDSALRGRLAAKGRERARQYEWSRVVPALEEAYALTADGG